MTEQTGPKKPATGRRAAGASFWFGLFAALLAVPPFVVFFFVPGYWLDTLNLTAYLSPILALLSLATGCLARCAPPARTGVILALLALILSAAWLLRGFYLFRAAVETARLWWCAGAADCGAQAGLIDALRRVA